ncbi:MAG TPA: FkbM family methyltransferase [Candidatus Angelobacter sp.]|nr:FkbM family methyltransferase [Candidatus Angelobacter sp.]
MGKQKVNESELVWNYLGGRKDGVFVEVGANHPTARSQTWFLESQGWSGVLIEPNPSFYELLREQRPKSQVFQVAVGKSGGEGEVNLRLAGAGLKGRSKVRAEHEIQASDQVVRVKVTTLNQVLEQSGISQIDFLSIDVEGMEFDVLAGFSFDKYRPRLFSIEDFCFSFEKKRFMRRLGYKLIRRVGYNNWYVPREAPVSIFTASTVRDFVRLIRKDFLSVPFIEVQRKFRVFKRR